MTIRKTSARARCPIKGMRYSKKWGCKVPCKSPMRRNSKGGCRTPKKRRSKKSSSSISPSRSSIRRAVLDAFRTSALDEDSPLTEVKGIGAYLATRLRRALSSSSGTTVGHLWRAMRTKTTDQVLRILYRALQNDRANQCVDDRSRRGGGEKVYHVGDVNAVGYEACAALLEEARRRFPVRYGPMPRTLPRRAAASKSCACRLTCDGPCTRTADGLCVPRASRAKGFLGTPPLPGQTFDDDSSSSSPLLSLANTRALRGDPDAAADLRNGHSLRLRYSRRGRRLWRHPGPRVRGHVVTR